MKNQNEKLLEDMHSLIGRAQAHAEMNSTCAKVKVGCMILTENFETIFGCNHGVERNCCLQGCLRKELYGEDSKNHRLPSDCVAIHSEVDAICKAAKQGLSLKNAVIFVTRYPCEACSRAIAESGIRTVVYGRKEAISPMSEKIFESRNINVLHLPSCDYADNNS